MGAGVWDARAAGPAPPPGTSAGSASTAAHSSAAPAAAAHRRTRMRPPPFGIYPHTYARRAGGMQEEGGRPAERDRPPHLPLQFKIRGLFCRRVRRDEGIPPYGRPGGCGCPVWPVVFGRFVGEGHGPPAGLAAARGPRDDASIVPYRGLRYRRGCGSPVGRWPSVGRRGGIYPSRGHLRQREVPGTMQASSPTEVCGLRRRAFKSWLAHLLKNAPALAGAKLWWASQGPRHPRPKKQSAGLFFAACAAGLSSPDWPIY